jgi:hypothetical protein
MNQKINCNQGHKQKGIAFELSMRRTTEIAFGKQRGKLVSKLTSP